MAAHVLEETWKAAQVWERNWWTTCTEQHPVEISKNNFVAKMMFLHDGAPGKTVIDIGSGPLSILLRLPVKKGTALDPLHFGELESAYESMGVRRLIMCGEDLSTKDGTYDEAWIYNCLQHVKDPQRIIENALDVAETVRIFEWINIPPYTGHLHELTSELLQAPFKKRNWHTLMRTTGYLNHGGLSGADYFMGIYSRSARENI